MRKPEELKSTIPNNFQGCHPEITELIKDPNYNINEFLRVCEKVQADPEWKKSREFKKRETPKTPIEQRRKMAMKKRAV